MVQRWRLHLGLGCVLAAANLLLAPASTRAGEQEDDLRRLIEMQQKQIEELTRRLDELSKAKDAPTAPAEGEEAAPPVPDENAVRKIVSDYLSDQEKSKKEAEEKKKMEAEAEGSVIGSDLKMGASWNHGAWLETQDKAFRIHAGGRLQYDVIWMGAQDNVEFGDNGTGPVRDGSNFRRARLEIDGTIYETIDFWCEYDWLNTFDAQRFDSDRPLVANTPAPTDLWFTITRLPWIGNLRVGNQKPPIGFEHLTSSRFLNFLERSYEFDAWIGGIDNGFTPGIQAFNWYLNERATWAFGVFKNNNQVFGWNQGNGELAWVGRLTFLPYYANQGRDLVHVGLGARYRTPDDGEFRYRARTLLRNGPAVLQTTLLDLRLKAENDVTLAPEFVFQFGPLLVQSEYFAVFTQNVIFPLDSGIERGDRFFHGFNVEVLYFLTGEHRAYNRVPRDTERVAIWDRVIPDENFFLVRRCEDCKILFGRGAWQIGARYDWIDLSDRGVAGGIAQDLTLGLNWFWNPNMKWQLNTIIEHRDVPSDPADSSDGFVYGTGVRFAWDF